MEFNRCSRCGAFFATQNNVCPNCAPKDACEQLTLKNYLEENSMPASMEALSADTGITIKNLNRFLGENDKQINL